MCISWHGICCINPLSASRPILRGRDMNRLRVVTTGVLMAAAVANAHAIPNATYTGTLSYSSQGYEYDGSYSNSALTQVIEQPITGSVSARAEAPLIDALLHYNYTTGAQTAVSVEFSDTPSPSLLVTAQASTVPYSGVNSFFDARARLQYWMEISGPTETVDVRVRAHGESSMYSNAPGAVNT